MITYRRTIALMFLMAAALLASGCIRHDVNGTVAEAKNTSEITVTPTLIKTNETRCQQNEIILLAGYPFRYNGTIPYPNISVVRVWIFGERYITIWFQSYTSRKLSYFIVKDIPVQSDMFNFTLTSGQAGDGDIGGKNRIILQYPQSGSAFGIKTRINQNRSEVYNKQGDLLINLSDIRKQKVNSFEAADLLENEIQKSGSGDSSTTFSLIVLYPVIWIIPISDHFVGDMFFINGTTNLPAGKELDIEITICCPRLPKGVIIPPRFTGTATVQPGFCGNNTWSALVNASSLYPNPLGQEWFVTVTSHDLLADGYAIANGYATFNISGTSIQTPVAPSIPNSIL